MTVIYFFFGHFGVFWLFFSLVRVTLGLLAIYVEKSLVWRLQVRTLMKKSVFFICSGAGIEITFHSINQEISRKDVSKTHLIQSLSLQYIINYLRLIVLLLIKLDLQIKTT